MAASASVSPASPAITPRSSRASSMKSKLSLDLSNIPPLVQPSPPSNTLLITNLEDAAIFEPQNLETIRNVINQHVTIHTWSPLKSFRRIIVSFYDIPSSVLIKDTLDGEVIMDCRVRVYFGAHTDMSRAAKHLEAPKVDKLFFISPPPSPPGDWEIRNEDPPNKEVHAEDLAHALSRLHATQEHDAYMRSPVEPEYQQRVRSGSTTLVYHPEQHGSNPSLPAISVEDTTAPTILQDEMDSSPMEDVRKPFHHTERPPIELMEC